MAYPLLRTDAIGTFHVFWGQSNLIITDEPQGIFHRIRTFVKKINAIIRLNILER